MRIGLLEESAAIAELLCTALRLVGHTVYVHSSAASLLEGMSAGSSVGAPQPYDFIILDLLIDEPQEMGLLALLEGRPLLVITASHPHLIARARQAHPRIVFLSKPFRLEVLSSHIERDLMRPTETSTTV